MFLPKLKVKKKRSCNHFGRHGNLQRTVKLFFLIAASPQILEETLEVIKTVTQERCFFYRVCNQTVFHEAPRISSQDVDVFKVLPHGSRSMARHWIFPFLRVWNDNDNDNDTLREVQHLSDEGLALQARV